MKMAAAFSVPCLLGLGFFWLMIKGDEHRCYETWKDSGYQTRLNFGCQVQIGGRWVPVEAVKITAQ